jgi:hypothetical protein
MARQGVACDLCELNRDIAWVIRTDEFIVGAGDADAPLSELAVMTTFGQDEEWALCHACKRDVLNDDQTPIMRRRRQALVMDSPEWNAMTSAERDAAVQVLEMTIMAVLSCRQKRWGRAWTARDAAQAAAAVERDGQRGLRHDGAQ